MGPVLRSNVPGSAPVRSIPEDVGDLVATVIGLQVEALKDVTIAEERLGDFFHVRGCQVSTVIVHSTGWAEVQFADRVSFTRALGITADDRKFESCERHHGWLRLHKQRFLTVVPKRIGRSDFPPQQSQGSKATNRFAEPTFHKWTENRFRTVDSTLISTQHPKPKAALLPRSPQAEQPKPKAAPLPRSPQPEHSKPKAAPLPRSPQPEHPKPKAAPLPRSSQSEHPKPNAAPLPRTFHPVVPKSNRVVQAKAVDPMPGMSPLRPWRPRREVLPCNLEDMADSKKQI